MTKLNSEQIKHIDSYLEFNGVEFEDIRLELVDHFVCGIEEQSFAKHDSFGKRLDLYLQSLPKNFIANYVRRSRRNLNKFWIKTLLSNIKVSNVIICYALSALVYFSVERLTTHYDIIFPKSMISIIFACVFPIILLYYTNRKLKNLNPNKYLILSTYVSFTYVKLLALYVLIYLILLTVIKVQIFAPFVTIGIITVFTLFLYITIIDLPSKMTSTLDNKYKFLNLKLS